MRAFLSMMMTMMMMIVTLPPIAEAPRHHRHRLVPPSLLLIPAVKEQMEQEGLIYRDTAPDQRWIVQNISHNDVDHSCPEVIYATLVLKREPPVHYHRTCNSPHLWSPDNLWQACQSHGSASHTNHCQPQVAYYVVKVDSRKLYQETFTGCVCSASISLSQSVS